MLLARRAGGGSALQRFRVRIRPKRRNACRTRPRLSALPLPRRSPHVPPATISPRAGSGDGATAESLVRLTDQTLSCAARAHVATAARHAACLPVRRAVRAASPLTSPTARADWAGGPKPGRVGFYGELGAGLV